MLSKLLLIALCICSLSATPSALDCNWMSCYATELKDCSVVAYKDECPTGVFVVYKEAPLFFSKRKCCKELTLEKAKEMYLYCAKTLQNNTHTCHSYEDREMVISTKNNCNRFGCVISNQEVEKKGVTSSDSSTPASGSKQTTESSNSPSSPEQTTASTEFRIQ